MIKHQKYLQCREQGLEGRWTRRATDSTRNRTEWDWMGRGRSETGYGRGTKKWIRLDETRKGAGQGIDAERGGTGYRRATKKLFSRLTRQDRYGDERKMHKSSFLLIHGSNSWHYSARHGNSTAWRTYKRRIGLIEIYWFIPEPTRKSWQGSHINK